MSRTMSGASHAFLADNIMGVAFAAFMPVELIARTLGGSLADATALKETAQYDWSALQIAIAQAKKPS